MLADWLTLETLAVVLAVAYLLLAIRENVLCWYCAFASSAIYVWIFGGVRLYMESLLNVFYVAMAVYGWWEWKRGGEEHQGVAISTWSGKMHLLSMAVILATSLVSGYLLTQSTDARLPFLDSFTTWASVFTTIMVARKILENWIYWIAIDSVSIYLYLDRGLYKTAALFTVYVIMAVFGYLAWRKHYLAQHSVTPAAIAG